MKNLKNILALLSILPGLACSDPSPQENRPDSPGINPPAKEEDNRTYVRRLHPDLPERRRR